MPEHTKLQEVYLRFLREGGELIDEGIHAHEFWLVRAGIDEDDFHEFCQHVLMQYGVDGNGETQARMYIAVGFLVGLQYGREPTDDEF